MAIPVSWYDINLDIISENVRRIKTYIGDTKLLAVLKSDAYGHGIVPVASVVVENGADYIGVSNLEEGVILRQSGIIAPILLLNAILPEQAGDTLAFDITPTVDSLEVASALNEICSRRKMGTKVHIKIDTGFGRYGILPKNVPEFVEIINKDHRCLFIEGVYTHFFSAQSASHTFRQYKLFTDTIEVLEQEGFSIPIKHACNSMATIRYPQMHLDMVRTGNLIYGFVTSKDLDVENPGKVMSKIVSIKTLPLGHGIGYGRRFKTRRSTSVGVVPFGYYDGLELLVSQPNGIVDGFKTLIKQMTSYFGFFGQNRKVKIRGIYCNILGKVGMQNCVVDLTPLGGNVSVGDEVELYPRKINLSKDLLRIYHYLGQTTAYNRPTLSVENLKIDLDFEVKGKTSIE